MKKTYNVLHDTLSPKKNYSQAKARQIVCHSMASASFEVCGRVKRDLKGRKRALKSVYLGKRDLQYANRKGTCSMLIGKNKGPAMQR
jgi:hypothetical protein